MPARPAELAQWSIARLAAAIRARQVAAAEATEACLMQLERLQPVIKCCIRIDAESARAAAARADARLARGEPCGLLHGVPLAHKDLFERAGRPTTCGSRIRADHVPQATATVLQHLDAAGAIDLGTLNMAEFAAGGTGHNAHWGDCVNPWNTDYTPGGSSSGSAAAVAARGVYGSLGTDTGGSLRWPAALCGVTALRPTLGRVSLSGVAPRAWSLDTAGPIARSAEDCALLLAAIAPDHPAALGAPARGLRVGVARGRWRADLTAEHEAALEASLEVLRRIGATTVDVQLPDPEAGFRLGDLIVKAEAASLHRRWLSERPDDYAPGIRAQLESGLAIPAAQYLEALRLRAPLLQEFMAAAFAHADVLQLPSHPFAAPTMAECAPSSASAVAAFWAAYPRYTRPLSYLGLPALALPCGMASAGVPIGCQLVGRPFDEARLLHLAHRYQRETDWHLRAPALALA
jgi:aspartyl-tRNA(Asn)/glutamyl-tRNA(Gln) amidotransferase subunit A